MSQPNTPHQIDAQILQAIKARYQTEYMMKAKSKLGWWNVFRGTDARLQKVEAMAERAMQTDIANGTLTARLADDLAKEKAAEEATAAKIAALPTSIGYSDITLEVIAAPRRAEPQQYDVNIPDIVNLRSAGEEDFLYFVLEMLEPFQLGSPNYVECAELKAIRNKTLPEGMPKPPTIGTIVTKKFNLAANGEVIRGDDIKNIMVLMHSDTQQELIALGAHAIAHYNQNGKIPLLLREYFMLEQTKEALRTAGYDFTPRYEMFCMNVLHHVVNLLPTLQPQPLQQAPQVSVKVSFDASAQNAPAANQDEKSAKQKKVAAPKPKG